MDGLFFGEENYNQQPVNPFEEWIEGAKTTKNH